MGGRAGNAVHVDDFCRLHRRCHYRDGLAVMGTLFLLAIGMTPMIAAIIYLLKILPAALDWLVPAAIVAALAASEIYHRSRND